VRQDRWPRSSTSWRTTSRPGPDLVSAHQRKAFEQDEKAPSAQALGDADLPEPSSVESVDVHGHDARFVLGKDVVFPRALP